MADLNEEDAGMIHASFFGRQSNGKEIAKQYENNLEK